MCAQLAGTIIPRYHVLKGIAFVDSHIQKSFGYRGVHLAAFHSIG